MTLNFTNIVHCKTLWFVNIPSGNSGGILTNKKRKKEMEIDVKKKRKKERKKDFYRRWTSFLSLSIVVFDSFLTNTVTSFWAVL
jgi:hypothetical protein